MTPRLHQHILEQQKTTMTLSFSDFRPKTQTVEIRYPENFLMWDRSGEIANESKLRDDDLKLDHAEPRLVRLMKPTGQVLQWEMTTMTATNHRPNSFKEKDFFPFASDALDRTTKSLELSVLNRVGFRAVYSCQVESSDEAGKKLKEAGLVNVPSGQIFNVEGVSMCPSFALRCDGEHFGFNLKIHFESLTYSYAPPLEWEEETVSTKIRNQILFDLDWYTIKFSDVRAFQLSNLLADVQHATVRDAKKFFK